MKQVLVLLEQPFYKNKFKTDSYTFQNGEQFVSFLSNFTKPSGQMKKIGKK